jgi:hypothetical protein
LFLVALGFLQVLQMLFGVIEQIDHHLADMLVEIMCLQRGERQEARASHHVDAIR